MPVSRTEQTLVCEAGEEQEPTQPAVEGGPEVDGSSPTPVENATLVSEEASNPPVELDPAQLQQLSQEEEIIDAEVIQKQRLEEEMVRQAKKKEEDRAKKRTEVLREILSTEETYVKNLLILEKEFLLPIKTSLQTRSPLLRENDYQTIFMDIEVIVKVNKALLDMIKNFFRLNNLLKDGIEGKPNEKHGTIGQIFIYMSNYLRSYNTYCNNYNSIFKIIEEQKKKSKGFKKFLQQTEFTQTVGFQNMISFMITPVQRIPRYAMLLTELIKQTPQDAPEYNDLVTAQTAIKQVATLVNERLRDNLNQERCAYLSTAISRLDFELVQPQRRFTKEGLVCHISTKKRLKQKYLFLFNDLLLLTHLKRKLSPQEEQDAPEQSSNPSSSSEQQGAKNPDDKDSPPSFDQPALDGPKQELSEGKKLYKLSSATSLKDTPTLVWLKDIPNNFVIRNAFHIVMEKKTWTVFCKTAEEKQEWLNTFQTTMTQLYQKIPKLDERPKATCNVPTHSSPTAYLDPANVVGKNLRIKRSSSARTNSIGNGSNGSIGSKPTTPVQDVPAQVKAIVSEESLSRRKKRSSFSKVSEFISKKFNKKAASTDLIEPFVSDSDDQSDDDEIGADIPKWMQRIDTRMEEYKDFYLMSSTMTKLTEEYRPMIAELKGEDYYCIQNPLFGLDDKSTKLSDDLLTYYDSISRPEEDDLDPNLAVHVSLLQAAQASTQNSAGSKTKKRLSLFFKN